MKKKLIFKEIVKIIQNRFKDFTGPILISVGGPGGTGKSTLCMELQKMIFDSCILRLDDYKLSRRDRNQENLYGSHPEANNFFLIRKHLRLLRQGNEIDKPVYDQLKGTANQSEKFSPCKYILIDGEISVYQDIIDLMDFIIFIDSHWKTQLNTRISRDVELWGFSPEKAISVFLQSNLRDFPKYGLPGIQKADIILYCDEDYHLSIKSIKN